MKAQVMHAVCDIPSNSRVVPGQGDRARAEMWVLINHELSFDWNYWIRIVQHLPRGNWVFRDVVAWYGLYDWTDTHNINTRPTADDESD